MRSRRILLATSEAPLPDGTAVGRWHYLLIRGLVRRGHRVTAFVACQQSQDGAETATLFAKPDYDVRCYAVPARSGMGAKLQTLRRPHSYSFNRNMCRDIRDECARGYDVLHLEGTFSGWLAAGGPTAKAVLAVHNLFSIDWARERRGWNQQLRRFLCLNAERTLLRRYPTLLTVSPRLAHEVRAIAPRSSVHVVPLTLDLANYSYIASDRRPQDPVVSLIGSMNWYPSRSAAERLVTRLWPVIRAKIPNARLQITGRDARRVLHRFLDQPGVEIFENVPATRGYFEQAGILLYAPALGSGVKVKILEAFAYGVPVVTTADGVEGIAAHDGVHAGIDDTDNGLIERSIRLLSDRALQEKQRVAARALLETDHAPETVLQRLEACYSN